MSDGTWNTAVMDPADVSRLIKDMREQVDSVSGTLDLLRAGLTRLEARVLAMPLPFETPAGEDSVSDASSQPADTYAPEVSMDGASAVVAQTDEATMAEVSAPWQEEAEAPAVEAETDEAAIAEASAPWQEDGETPAMEVQTEEAPSAEQPSAEASAPWQAEVETPAVEAETDEATMAEAVAPEVETAEAQRTDLATAEAPAYEPEATSADEAAAEASDVEAPPEPSPEPSWLAAEAALDSIWGSRPESATPDSAAAEPRKPSLTGWPDESIWSPSYEWKPVAQRSVEAGTQAEAELPAADAASPAEATGPADATQPAPPVVHERYVDNSWLTSAADTSFWPAFTTKEPKTPEDGQRKDVAETVSQMRDELAAAASGSEANDSVTSAEADANPADEASRREEVARAVARMRAELGYGQPQTPATDTPETVGSALASDSGSTTSAADDEAVRREEVASAVARLREEFGDDDAGEATVAAPDGINFDNASTQAEPSSEVAPAQEAEALSDEEARREEVRRAVEAARAELSGGTSAIMAPPAAPAPSRFSLSDWTVEQERDGPPVIVIKDSDGRVELAHVYEALNRVSCGDSAALLNYTPHSVTIGLPVRAVVPDDVSLVSAFESVFGRPCRVQSDGVRISVSMGTEHGRNEEAA